MLLQVLFNTNLSFYFLLNDLNGNDIENCLVPPRLVSFLTSTLYIFLEKILNPRDSIHPLTCGCYHSVFPSYY